MGKIKENLIGLADPVSQMNAAAGIKTWSIQIEKIREAQAERDKKTWRRFFPSRPCPFTR